MSDCAPKSYHIKYDVHCKLQNFFGKEMIVKNCYSALHAKMKLSAYYEKKYGKEFEYMTFHSVEEETSLGSLFDKTFGNKTIDDYCKDFLSFLDTKKNKNK